MFEVDNEVEDFHATLTVLLVEACLISDFDEIEFDGSIEIIDALVELAHLRQKLAAVLIERFPERIEHALDDIGYAQGFGGGVGVWDAWKGGGRRVRNISRSPGASTGRRRRNKAAAKPRQRIKY